MQFPPTTNNYIGRSQFRGDPYFDGKIDDFRIYRGALTTGSAYTLATGLAPAAPAPAPTTFTVTAQIGGSMVLNWSASAGATSYTVRRSTTPGGPYTAIASLLTGTSYTDTGLTAGTTYYYVVDAANTGGGGAYSSQAGAVALPPLPSAPTNLLASAASSTSAGLVWTAATNAVSYNIKRSGTSGGPYTTVQTGVTATTYTNTGLTTGTTYYYVVSAVNAAGESGNSNEDNATPTDLLAQLKFDETSGTTAWDSTGYGWNGTTMNGPVWTAGTLGNAISLASGSSQYVTIPSSVVSGLGDFTVSTWVYLNSVTSNTRIFDFGTSTTPSSTVGTYMFLTPSYGGGAVSFRITTSGYNNEKSISGTAALTSGTWRHVAVTLSGSTGKLYVNGTLVGTNTSMTLSPSSLGSTTQNYLGRSQYSADPYLNGLLDDFRIYTRALSASEITSLVSAPLAKPQNVVATSGYQQVALTWNAVPNAANYILRSSTVSGGPYAKVASALTSPGFTQTGLSGSTVYYYVVSAVNALGEGPNSAEVSSSALATPGAPAGLTATTGNASAVLNWTLFNDVLSYNVYRSTTSGTGYTMVASGLTGATYSDTGLTNGVTYYYVITGVNSGGEGPYSAEASATPLPPPVITSAATAGGIIGGTFSYQITASNSPISYGATGLPAGLSVDTATGIISGTMPKVSGTYSATISATNVGGTGSATLAISALYVAPAAPTGLTTARGSATVILSWAASNGATSYNVRRSTTSGTDYTTVASNLTTLNFTDTGLTDGTTYYYIVSAVNSAGEGLSSSQTSATPATVSADWFTQLFTSSTNNTTSNTTFTFTPANNTNKYIVSRRTGVTAFPVSTSGTTITGGDDTSTKVTLSGTSKVVLYSGTYSSFYIGSNGYITFASDTTYNATIANHFKRPRISALFDDLDSTNQGTMSWIQLSDRVAVTWLNVPQYGTSNSNNFQVEMFFDGRIRITCLAFADTVGLIGLSGVSSTPSGFVQSTFSSYPAPLAAPGGLTATGSNSAIALRWSDSTGATTYNVKRSGTSGGPYSTIASGTLTHYSDTGLANGTAYYYVVSAVNSLVGEGVDSAEASGTPVAPASAPTGLVATGGSAAVALSWNTSSGAASYTVLRSLTSGSGYTPLDGGTTAATSYNDTGLASGTTYYYVVTASNLGGTSGNSAEAGATTYTAVQLWRLAKFGTISNSGSAADSADPDGDGMTNAQEFAAGTNPASAASVLKISQMLASGNNMVVSFPTVVGKIYRVDRSDTLQTGSWTTVQDNISGTGGTVQVTDSGGAAQPRRFYRVIVNP